jgi:hypothetical protein
MIIKYFKEAKCYQNTYLVSRPYFVQNKHVPHTIPLQKNHTPWGGGGGAPQCGNLWSSYWKKCRNISYQNTVLYIPCSKWAGICRYTVREPLFSCIPYRHLSIHNYIHFFQGFDPRRGQRIFPLASVSRPALGPTQPTVQLVPEVLSPGVKRDRGVMLTTHPYLVPRSWMSKSYTSSRPKRLHGV